MHFFNHMFFIRTILHSSNRNIAPLANRSLRLVIFSSQFQLLTSILFRKQSNFEDASHSKTLLNELTTGVATQQCVNARDVHNLRTELYNKLAEFFPESLTQPRANLIDLLPL